MVDKPVLILGAGGMLAHAFGELFEGEGVPYTALTIADFNFERPGDFEQVDDRWGVIINCAAYTQVDLAEEQEELAARINGTAVGALAERAKRHGSTLIHFSTDYVFDGTATSPYEVETKPAPVSAYGRTKALGERLIAESGAASLVVRTSWLYAGWGNNFVLTIAKLLETKPELKVVNDQRGRPTHAVQLAERSWALHRRGAEGFFHVTDSGECTWYDFAKEIGLVLGLQTPVHPVATSEFPRPAPRPAYSVLDTSKADALIGVARPWQVELRAALALRK
jgi:dTDP-4-dehydrorhamnose reductase